MQELHKFLECAENLLLNGAAQMIKYDTKNLLNAL